MRAPAGKGEVALVHGTGEGYAAPPRTVHRFAVWAKGDAGRIVIEPRADAGGLGTFPVWVGGEWKRFEGTFVTRADTRRLVLAFRVPRAAGGDAPRTLCVDDLTLEQLPPGLAGWWKLDDPNAVVARDLAGACPDGTIYRRWHVGEPWSQIKRGLAHATRQRALNGRVTPP